MRKGGMDEVLCDITALADAMVDTSKLQSLPTNAFIYGNDESSVVLTEDQSGAQSIVRNHCHAQESSFHDDDDDVLVQRRLYAAAACAERIRQAIHTNTGFTTSMGVSVSPMLSKIASSLKKPNGLVVLYPWRASSLVYSMPLGKVPQLGRTTLKALEPCLQYYNHGKQQQNGGFWTCR
jgi:nucleotidyltransferase/DNA polymerase involved in DNA repair